MTFVKKDDFWDVNALSPNGLLTLSKNGSRKIDNILIKMKPKEDKLKQAFSDFIAANKPADYCPF